MSSARGKEITPKMRRQMKQAQLAKLQTAGLDVPDHLLPTPAPLPPTPYPLKIAEFTKLFWQTSTNVKFEVFRLNPRVFPGTLCLVPTDIDRGVELNRLYFDQVLLQILIRPDSETARSVTQLRSSVGSASLLNPIRERGRRASAAGARVPSGSSPLQEARRKSLRKKAAGGGGGEEKSLTPKAMLTAGNAAKAYRSLDKEGKAIQAFLMKKLLMKRAYSPKKLKPVTPAPLAPAESSGPTKAAGGAEDAGGTPANADSGLVASAAEATSAAAAATGSTQATPASPVGTTIPVHNEELISIRGIATTSAPNPVPSATEIQTAAALVPYRTRATSFNSFQNLHRDMESAMEKARRSSVNVERSSQALNKQLSILERFRMMRVRASPNSGDSVAKRRWKKACRRVVMDAAVERTRDILEQKNMLTRQQRNTLG